MDMDVPDDPKEVPKTIVAPDPQSDPDDPYDPENPDDASNPDDSNDIPIVELEWIDTHSKDKAYRIVDSDNILVSNRNTTYDVIVLNQTSPGYLSYSTLDENLCVNTVSALGHNHTGSNVAATCTAQGYTKYSCTRCSNTYNGNYTNALGHSYSVTSNTASCGKNGTKTETCSRCGNQKTSTSQGTSHTLKTETKAATCGSTGYEKTYCTTCGTQTAYKEIAKNGTHNFVSQVVSEATAKAQAAGLEASLYANGLNKTFFMAEACTNCYIFKNTLLPQYYTLRYDNWTMANEMLGYVNNLRRSVRGNDMNDDWYDLQLSSNLMSIAQRRAQEIVNNFTHNNAATGTGENIAKIGEASYSIVSTMYKGWEASSGHYDKMTDEDWKYFGYAVVIGSNGTLYGVQVFSAYPSI
jgi:uncharacterized protein YkwD